MNIIQHIFIKKDISATSDLPADRSFLNKPIRSGPVAYHVRDGEHDLILKDWNFYMDFADTVMKKLN